MQPITPNAAGVLAQILVGGLIADTLVFATLVKRFNKTVKRARRRIKKRQQGSLGLVLDVREYLMGGATGMVSAVLLMLLGFAALARLTASVFQNLPLRPSQTGLVGAGLSGAFVVFLIPLSLAVYDLVEPLRNRLKKSEQSSVRELLVPTVMILSVILPFFLLDVLLSNF